MPRALRVATVAMTPDHNPAVSRDRLCQFVRRAKREQPEVRLIHLGETILGWFNCETRDSSIAYHREIAEAVPGPTTEQVGKLARDLDVYISLGLTERDGGKVYNTQILIDPNGEVIAKHRKFWLRTSYFEPGERRLSLAKIDGARIAFVICADVRSFWLLRAIRRARVDVVLASLADYGTDKWMNCLMGCFFDAWNVIANRYGKEPHNNWRGMMTVTDRWGRLRGHSVDCENILYCEIPLGRSGDLRRLVRRSAVFVKLLGLTFQFGLRELHRAIGRRLRRSRAGT